MKTREDERMVKLEFLSKLPFLRNMLQKSTHSIFVAWSFLLVHIRFTPSEHMPFWVSVLLKIPSILDPLPNRVTQYTKQM
jgi:hypothetical protein